MSFGGRLRPDPLRELKLSKTLALSGEGGNKEWGRKREEKGRYEGKGEEKRESCAPIKVFKSRRLWSDRTVDMQYWIDILGCVYRFWHSVRIENK